MKKLEKERQGAKKGSQRKVDKQLLKWTGDRWRFSSTIQLQDKFIYNAF